MIMYLHKRRGVYEEECDVDELQKHARHVDGGYQQGPGLGESVVSPQGRAQKCAYVGEPFEILG